MTETFKNRLNQQITIYKMSDLGGGKEGFAEYGTANVYLYMLDPEEALQVEGVYTKSYRLIGDENLNLSVGDKVVDGEGKEYRVKGVDKKLDRNGNLHHIEAILEEI